MNRFRLLVVAILCAAGISLAAQQPSDPQSAPQSMATAEVDHHLAVLSDKLDLSIDQQSKARPILQQMHDASAAIEADESISTQERNERTHAVMMKADRELRLVLTDEQKKKLDTMEQQMQAPQGGGPSPAPQHK
jgi:hypothetical protein